MMNDVSRLHCGNGSVTVIEVSAQQISTRSRIQQEQHKVSFTTGQNLPNKWQLKTFVFWSLITDDVIISYYVIAIINQSIVYSKG